MLAGTDPAVGARCCRQSQLSGLCPLSALRNSRRVLFYTLSCNDESCAYSCTGISAFSATRVRSPAGFQPGKILKLERKTRSRVLYYMVNTPITLEDPYYDVSVQLKQTIYMAEYEPRHSQDALPDQW